jgi:hypothetical protein
MDMTASDKLENTNVAALIYFLSNLLLDTGRGWEHYENFNQDR